MSSYSLLRESRVVIVYDGRAFEFGALSNISSSLSYDEYKSNRKTLHNKTNYPLSIVTSQSPTSVSLNINMTNNLLEANFFQWLGMDRYNNTFALPLTSPTQPKYLDIYITSTESTTVQITKCFVSTVDFALENGIPVLNISVEGAKQSLIGQMPIAETLLQGAVLKNSPLIVKANSMILPGVQGASASFQQQCSWRDQRSIHDIGSIYNHSVAIVSEMNVSATVNAFLVRRTTSDNALNIEVEYNTPIKIYNTYLSLDMPSTRITKRLDVQDVYGISYDIVPMETSDPVTLTLFGE